MVTAKLWVFLFCFVLLLLLLFSLVLFFGAFWLVVFVSLWFCVGCLFVCFLFSFYNGTVSSIPAIWLYPQGDLTQLLVFFIHKEIPLTLSLQCQNSNGEICSLHCSLHLQKHLVKIWLKAICRKCRGS